jgi:hypothetical protein
MTNWESEKKKYASVRRKDSTQQKRNRYCSATYWCPFGGGIKTALFLFMDGQRRFGEDDMITYIDWFLLSSRLSLEEINCNIDLEACEQIRKADPFVDWNTVNRAFYETIGLDSCDSTEITL